MLLSLQQLDPGLGSWRQACTTGEEISFHHDQMCLKSPRECVNTDRQAMHRTHLRKGSNFSEAMEHLIMLKRKGKNSRSKLGVWKVKDSLFFDRAFYKREIITVNIPSILISFSSWLLRNNKSPSNFADHQTSLSFSYKDHKTGNGITCILNVTSPNPTQNIPTWQMLRPCSVSHCWSSLHSTLEKLTNHRDFSQTMQLLLWPQLHQL